MLKIRPYVVVVEVCGVVVVNLIVFSVHVSYSLSIDMTLYCAYKKYPRV